MPGMTEAEKANLLRILRKIKADNTVPKPGMREGWIDGCRAGLDMAILCVEHVENLKTEEDEEG